MLKSHRLLYTLPIGLLLFLPAVRAQDFFNSGVSARTAANAGVYAPATGSAIDALSMNPAGLATLTGPVADVCAAGMLARGSFSNSSNFDSPMRFNGGATVFGAFGTPIGHSRWTAALGILPDLLSSSKWQFQDSPGVGGANYGAQHERSEILAYRIPMGVSYRVNSRLFVGATVSAIYNSNRLEMPYVFQSHPALRGLKTLLDLHTTGTGWNTSFGVIAKVSHTVDLAASYRTKSSITSSGTASGNLGAQFTALGIPFAPDFSYRAHVSVELPQAATVSANWQKSHALRFGVQGSWTDWSNSFRELPVSLSSGSNAAVNSLLNSTSLNDTVPLDWKNQFSFRGSVERLMTERLSVSGGFVHANDPVPSSTLSPMTAAIMSNGLATGFGYVIGRSRLDLAYQFNFANQQSTGNSALLSGEFNNSRVKIGTQALTLSTSFHF